MTSPVPLRCAVLLAVLAVQRTYELWLSRRHLAGPRARSSARAPLDSSLDSAVDSPRGAPLGATLDAPLDSKDSRRAAGSRADWYAMIAIHVALIVLPALEVVFLSAQAGDTLFWIAALAYAAAQMLRYWSIASLGACWNARAVVDAHQPCVVRGPYRWIRHPNYLAVLIDFSAVPLALGAWRSWILLNLLHAPVLMRRIFAEEKLLAEIPGYADHMLAKGRFVPRWRALAAKSG